MTRARLPPHTIVALTAWVCRLTSIAVSLLSTRALVEFLGVERYGAFAIIVSLGGWCGLAEAGLGPSLQNFVSEARARGESYGQYLRAGQYLIALLALIVGMILFLVGGFIQNLLLAKFPGGLSQETFGGLPLVTLAGGLFVGHSLLGISYRILLAKGSGNLAYILPALGGAFSLLGLLAANHWRPIKNPLAVAILLGTAPPTVLAGLGWWKAFHQEKLGEVPFALIKEAWKPLFSRALRFGGFAAMSAVTLQIDYLVMSQTLSPQEITQYNLITKVYLIVIAFQGSYLMTAWPVITECMNRHAISEVHVLVNRSLWLGFALVGVCSIILLLTPDLVYAIIAPSVTARVDRLTLGLFALYFSCRVWAEPFAITLISVNSLRIFWLYVPIQALINAGLQISLANLFGLKGILAGLICSFLLTAAWILPWKYRAILWKFAPSPNPNPVQGAT